MARNPIIREHNSEVPTDHKVHEGSEEGNCFYCLSGWVFLGSLDHDGEEVFDAVCCRKCGGTGRIDR